MNFERLFDEANEGFLVLEAGSLEIIHLNKKASELVGSAPERLRGTPFADLLKSDDGLELSRSYRNLVRTGTALIHDAMLKGSDDSSIPVAISASLVATEKGSLVMVTLRKAQMGQPEDDSTKKHAFMVESTHDYMTLINAEFVYEAANPAALRAHNQTADEFIGARAQEVWGDELFFSVIKPNLESCLEGEHVYYQAWFDFARTDRRWMATSYSPYKNEDGEITHVVVTARDITQKKLGEEERESYLKTLTLLEEVVLELDNDLKIRRVNEAWAKIMPNLKDSRSIIGSDMQVWIDVPDWPNVQSALGRLLRGQEERELVRFRVNKSEVLWLEGIFIQQWEGGKVSGIRGTLRDITTTYKQERQIEHLAFHDSLTNLPNRFSLTAHLNEMVAGHERGGFAVIFVDLDGFNQINDGLGYKVGDKVLCGVALRIQKILPPGCNLYRWAGDEFVIVVRATDNPSYVRQVMQILKSSSNQPLRIDDLALHITFSGGLAMFPDDTDNVDTLLTQAHKAALYGKRKFRNHIQIYSRMPADERGREELVLRNSLTQDVMNDRINVRFQPKVNADTGRVIGMEALARWNSKDQGPVEPNVFIPMAEELGLMVSLGAQVMKKSFAFTRKLRDQGFEINVAINISQRQLLADSFVPDLIGAVEKQGLTPEMVTLEITESISIFEGESILPRLTTLSKAGFVLSIDDFGTGYSSLSQLHAMPVKELKIDLAFINRIKTDAGLRLVQAIIQMANALELNAVAEGVSDEETLAILKRLGVFEMQGYLFSRAMSEEEFVHFLTRGTPGVLTPG